jgi:hypothetical protein
MCDLSEIMEDNQRHLSKILMNYVKMIFFNKKQPGDHLSPGCLCLNIGNWLLGSGYSTSMNLANRPCNEPTPLARCRDNVRNRKPSSTENG